MTTDTQKIQVPQTPLMQQFWEIKKQHPDKILLYRMGDFYEMFFDDAVKAAPILNIALTSRNKSQGQDIPMCGVPHHSIGPQINKLLASGLKVAICDQVEDPKQAKGIVKRAVTRVVTPGLVYDPETLDAAVSNFVAAIIKEGESSFQFAALDASTGEFYVAHDLTRGDLSAWVLKLEPKEFIVESDTVLPFETQTLVTLRVRAQSVDIQTYLLTYAQETQNADILLTLQPPRSLRKSFLKISPTTIRHLELFKRMDGETEFSLFWAVDLTKTPMGARLLRQRLATPFSTETEIVAAQQQTQYFVDQNSIRDDLRSKLTHVGDLERKIARLSNPLCNARDLQGLGRALGLVSEIFDFELPQSLQADVSRAKQLSQKILATLQEELPHSTKEGGLIRPGLHSVLDEYVELSTHAQTKLSELEQKERESTGIQSLKIKYNSVFGYSFEVTKSNLDKVPGHFVRRQTLAQGERFVTAELSNLEQKILSAQSKRCELEYQIFADLKVSLLKEAIHLLALCAKIAEIDVASSWAKLASEQNYCRPQVSAEYKTISLKDSRHAVLEKSSTETFIGNDIQLPQRHCLLLTGPNMAGKSTIMRQVALIAILAQCGSFVPASEAKLPLFDQIFTRIGASDNLSRGLSTFMVEMTETAEIIKAATENSLVILDEIGRGTSTYDGMSLAQAVLEHFLTQIGSFTFFATHYHELTDLEKEHKTILNAHMTIKEHRGQLIFLRKLGTGPANRSYGIDVAKQAGLPLEITKRAAELLKGLAVKSRELDKRQMNLFAAAETITEEPTLPNPLPGTDLDGILETLREFRELNVNALTPLEALNKLHGFQKTLATTELPLS